MHTELWWGHLLQIAGEANLKLVRQDESSAVYSLRLSLGWYA
jgi:hypothetical protein